MSARDKDGTERLLQEWGIPCTRENYLHLAFAGHPPTPPFDGELLLEFPRWLRAEILRDDRLRGRLTKADRKMLRAMGVRP